MSQKSGRKKEKNLALILGYAEGYTSEQGRTLAQTTQSRVWGGIRRIWQVGRKILPNYTLGSWSNGALFSPKSVGA